VCHRLLLLAVPAIIRREGQREIRAAGMIHAMHALDPIRDLVDAAAPGLAKADLVFVFGSTQPGPVDPVARLLQEGWAPFAVLTGGPNRRTPEHIESERHAELLRARGVPDEQLIVENRSTTSVGNVAEAVPLIAERYAEVRTVIAVVKWWQRRQLHVLAKGMPSVERIYSVTWNPAARVTGLPYDTTNWAQSGDRMRIKGEYEYFRRQLHQGDLPWLARNGDGWVRA
jgi:uncharacterized SAM-binding protein YcdF (DUF218 family)